MTVGHRGWWVSHFLSPKEQQIHDQLKAKITLSRFLCVCVNHCRQRNIIADFFWSKYTLNFGWKLMAILFWAKNSLLSPTKWHFWLYFIWNQRELFINICKLFLCVHGLMKMTWEPENVKWISSLSLTSCVTLDRTFNFPELTFFTCKMGITIRAHICFVTFCT